MLAELRLFFIDPQTGGFHDLVWKAVISVSNFPDKSCVIRLYLSKIFIGLPTIKN
jgi:hypothetical protein